MNQGDKLKKILKKNSKTQTELADFMEMTQSNLSRLLNSVNLDPRLIQGVSKLLGIEMEDLEKQLSSDITPEKSAYQLSLEAHIVTLQNQLKDKEIIIAMQQTEIEKARKKG